jgi:hypothetical protein
MDPVATPSRTPSWTVEAETGRMDFFASHFDEAGGLCGPGGSGKDLQYTPIPLFRADLWRDPPPCTDLQTARASMNVRK